jgi:4,5-DOPA dioxygenase extradiol
VLILGSGNVVHNLRRLDRSSPDGGFDWARRFGDDATALLATRPASAADLQHHADYRAAVPTTDHFIPILYIAGSGRMPRAQCSTPSRRLRSAACR